MKSKGFDSDRDALRFIQSKADDIERAMVYVCKPYEEHPNVGLTLFLLSGDRLQLSKERAVQVLNEGILARMNIETTFC